MKTNEDIHQYRIRRSLLNENQLEVIRELSSQINLPPLDYPMHRISVAEWDTNKMLSEFYCKSYFINLNGIISFIVLSFVIRKCHFKWNHIHTSK
jgi:hypothetical protein